MKTVFSGIQPSGELHLGNYLGAIRQWVNLQDEYFCTFCVVDYHAITQDYDAKQMKQGTFDMAADVLSCGVDPERAILFVQSAVPEHTELCWVLNTVTQFGDLGRMTQFKDKSARQADNINVGLFDYPVLQAADILLYKGQLVPVGQDQVQHVELTRRIARAFNRRFGKVFPEPDAKLSTTPKILGLDGQAKMSKSIGNTIAFSDTDKQIRKKLGRAVTDPQRVQREDPGDPERCNVHTLHNFFSPPDKIEWVQSGCRSAKIGCVDCKGALGDAIIEHLTPIRRRREEFAAEPDRVHEALERGRTRASDIAQKTMGQVRKKLGAVGIGLSRQTAAALVTALAAVAVAFAVVGSAEGDQDSPQGAVRSFEAAARRGDRQLMFELLGPRTRAQLEQSAGKASTVVGGGAAYGPLDLILPRPASGRRIARIVLLDESDRSARMELVYDDGIRHQLRAVEEDNRWRLEFVGSELEGVDEATRETTAPRR